MDIWKGKKKIGLDRISIGGICLSLRGKKLFEHNFYEKTEDKSVDISPKLLRLIEQEEKKTMPYQETLKVINLGTLEK